MNDTCKVMSKPFMTKFLQFLFRSHQDWHKRLPSKSLKSETRIGKEFEKSPIHITGCQAGCSSFAPLGLVAHAFFATQSHPLLPIEVLILPLLFSYSLQKGLATFHHVFLSWISPLNPNTKQWLSFLFQNSPHNSVWHFTPCQKLIPQYSSCIKFKTTYSTMMLFTNSENLEEILCIKTFHVEFHV